MLISLSSIHGFLLGGEPLALNWHDVTPCLTTEGNVLGWYNTPNCWESYSR